MRPHPSGVTVQLLVTDIGAAETFYSRLFGRGPDFRPHDDFLEWRVVPDTETWWQIVEVPADRHTTCTRMRLRVDDIAAAVAWATDTLDVTPSAVTALPGVVSFVDFTDPWGNPLGFFEDLVPVEQAVVPGGSVHDESQFIVDSPRTDEAD